MAITARTLPAAIGATDTVFALDSATGVTAPNFTTGVGITYLFVETECMLVTGLASTVVTVQRGYAGTPAAAHGITANVLAGSPADFGAIVPSVKAFQPSTPYGTMYGSGGLVASAATIAASGPIFHVSGGTAINIITPPTGMVEGFVTVIFDSVCTWTSSNVTNGIIASGTSTTAGSAVTFYLDGSTLRWYPSRLA